MSVPAQAHPAPPAAARIDFGWIKQAWALFSAQAGVWVAAMFLCFIIDVAVWVLLSIPTGVMTNMRRDFASVGALQHPIVSAHPYREFAQTRALGLLIGCAFAVFNGGFYQMALRQKRGAAISVSGLFSGFPQAVPLAVVGTAMTAAINLMECIGLWLLHFSMAPTAAVSTVSSASQILALILPGLFMFAPLLIVDAGANVTDALLGSVRLLRSRWLKGIAFYIVVSLITFMGAFLCGIGLLVTCPLFFLSIAIGYLALTQPEAAERPAFDPALVGVWPPPPQVPEEERR